MAKPRNATREVLLSLAAAFLLGGAIAGYIMHTMPTREQLATSYIAPAAGAPAPRDDVAFVADIANRFVAALAAKNYADAYALMAQPYRDGVPLDAFRTSCTRSAFLAGATRAVVYSTRRNIVPGTGAIPYTLQGTGMIVSAAGSVDAGFTLLVNGDDARILVLSLANVPVLNGLVTGAAQ